MSHGGKAGVKKNFGFSERSIARLPVECQKRRLAIIPELGKEGSSYIKGERYERRHCPGKKASKGMRTKDTLLISQPQAPPGDKQAGQKLVGISSGN